MRFLTLAPALAAALTVSIVSAARAELTIGDPAPVLKVGKWVKGEPITLAKGKVHVVEFWATWCPPCRETIPHLTKLAKKFQNEADFTGVSISNSTNAVVSFVKEMGAKMDYNVAVDTDSDFMSTNWMKAAKRNSIPTAFIIDKEGKIAWIGYPGTMEGPLSAIIEGKWDIAMAKERDAEEKAVEVKEKAAEVKEEAAEVKKQQEDVAAFGAQLETLLAEGKTDEVLALADKTAATSPFMTAQVAQTLFMIAYTVAESKEELPPQLAKLKDAILPMAQKAVDLTKGEDGFMLDTLAFIHYKAGNVKKALALQKKAIAKLPENTSGVIFQEMKERLALYKSKQ